MSIRSEPAGIFCMGHTDGRHDVPAARGRGRGRVRGQGQGWLAYTWRACAENASLQRVRNKSECWVIGECSTQCSVRSVVNECWCGRALRGFPARGLSRGR